MYLKTYFIYVHTWYIWHILRSAFWVSSSEHFSLSSCSFPCYLSSCSYPCSWCSYPCCFSSSSFSSPKMIHLFQTTHPFDESHSQVQNHHKANLIFPLVIPNFGAPDTLHITQKATEHTHLNVKITNTYQDNLVRYCVFDTTKQSINNNFKTQFSTLLVV